VGRPQTEGAKLEARECCRWVTLIWEGTDVAGTGSLSFQRWTFLVLHTGCFRRNSK